MKEYYIVFVNDRYKPICGKWTKGSNREEAINTTEWELYFQHPDVVYFDIICEFYRNDPDSPALVIRDN